MNAAQTMTRLDAERIARDVTAACVRDIEVGDMDDMAGRSLRVSVLRTIARAVASELGERIAGELAGPTPQRMLEALSLDSDAESMTEPMAELVESWGQED